MTTFLTQIMNIRLTMACVGTSVPGILFSTLRLSAGVFHMRPRLRWVLPGLLVVQMLVASMKLDAQGVVLDGYSAGTTTITARGLYDQTVASVFGGYRDITYNPLSSGGYISVGAGALTWQQNSAYDYGVIEAGRGVAGTQTLNLSSYEALLITVISAPQNAGQMNFQVVFQTSPSASQTVNVPVAVPVSGTVTVPFSAFISAGGAGCSFSSVDEVGLYLGGTTVPGKYVFNNLIAVPEPSSWWLMSLGIAGCLWTRRAMNGGSSPDLQN
jgi:hypothetical protein